jgi:hypothetical protein
MYTSRSSIELSQSCPRKRYLHDFYDGIGVVPFGRSPHLATGSAVHEGIGHLTKRIKLLDGAILGDPQGEIDVAVQIATSWFQNECENKKFYGKGVRTDRQTEHTYKEQLALVEALVRAWGMVEMPNLVNRFRVIGTEREIAVKLAEGVDFQARVDSELQEREGGGYYNYSLKTTKEWNERMEVSYREDLQGITEVWAVEEDARVRRGIARECALAANKMLGRVDSEISKEGLRKIQKFMVGMAPVKKVMGVRFCFLCKGNRKQSDVQDPDSLWVTYSPLIRGYKHFSPGGVEYAHSWFYPNAENRSGKGALGKGWEPFNVWESTEFTIKSWLELIGSGQIQPECGEVIKSQVVVPVEYYRNEREIVEGIVEIQHQEEMVKYSSEQAALNQRILPVVFPKYRRSCHWPTECEYHKICYQPEVEGDILGSGYYERRIPHHAGERESNIRKGS